MVGAGALLTRPDRVAQDLAFAKVVSKCRSFVIVAQAYETTVRNGVYCLGELTAEQMMARQTHLLPWEMQKAIAFLRIWVSRARRPVPSAQRLPPRPPPGAPLQRALAPLPPSAHRFPHHPRRSASPRWSRRSRRRT